MIQVDRTKEPVPAILADHERQTGGPKETQRAIDFYRKKKNRTKAFPFKAYRDASVKQALERLFGAKCAYCESDYGNHPWEVEHWRPKGEVDDEHAGKIKPGYYWLAADWDNLFLACIDCNRQRYHKAAGADAEMIKLGKKNSFPLVLGSRRARKPGEETTEEPLLLHPCEDDPKTYLRFVETAGEEGVIRPKSESHDLAFQRADASLTVYGLNRAELVLKRKKVLILIQAQVRRVKEAEERVESATDPVSRERQSAIYDREMRILLSYAEPAAPFSLMGLQFVAQFLRNYVPLGVPAAAAAARA